MKRKILALILAMAFIMGSATVFTSCSIIDDITDRASSIRDRNSGKDKDDDEDDDEDDDDDDDDDDEDETEDTKVTRETKSTEATETTVEETTEVTETTETTVAETTVEETTETTTEETTRGNSSDVNYVGYIDNDVYYNEGFGFKFVANGKWVLMDASEYLNIASSASLEDIDIDAAIASSGSSIIMGAMSSENLGTNINIAVLNKIPGFTNSSSMMELYAQTTANQMSSMIDGDTEITSEVITTTFLGEEVYAIKIAYVLSGFDVTAYLVMYEVGDYMLQITVSTMDGAEGDELANNIFGLFEMI